MKKLTILPLFLTIAACGGEASTDSETVASGSATFQDAATEPDGSSREAATPSDGFTVSIEFEGTGDLSGLDPSCLDGLGGNFVGSAVGVAEVDEGIYLAAMGEGATTLTTPSGCEIPSISFISFTRVVVRAELIATTQSCDGYCSAKARSHAESECSAASDQLECRAAAEGEYEASCDLACADETNVIVAEVELGVAARAELLLAATASGFGQLDADLTFDHIENDGGTVDEAP